MKSTPENIFQHKRYCNISIKAISRFILLALFIGSLSTCARISTMTTPVIVRLPADKPLSIRTSPRLALSADGRQVVYPADTVNSDTRQLYLQPVNGQRGRFLAGTTNAESPFFSADGKWVAYFSDGKLKKVSVDGGKPILLTEARAPTGGYWGTNDTIVFADGPVWQVSAAGGTRRQVTQIRQGERHSWPILLANGKLIFNLFQRDSNVPRIVIQQIGSNKRITLLEEGNNPYYSGNGYLIFNERGSLMAVPLDITRDQLIGEPVIVTENVLLAANTGAAQYSVSQSGALVYVPGKIFGESRRIVFLDRQGNERDPGLPLRRYSYVRYSADGQKLAIETDGQVLIQDLQDKTTHALIQQATYPIWGPGREMLTFSSLRKGLPGLFQVSINKPEAVETLITGEYSLDHSYSWSTDGQLLAYTEIRPDTGMDIWVKNVDTQAEPVLNSAANECCPVFSPDGIWMAYISDETGRGEVYLKSLAAAETKYKISENGAREPVWSHAGTELYYWQDRQLMAVEISTNAGFRVSRARPLFEGVFVSSTSTWRSRYDISPADDEFVIIRRGAEELGITELKYIANWENNLEQ